jgi:hypothetical protein
MRVMCSLVALALAAGLGTAAASTAQAPDWFRVSSVPTPGDGDLVAFMDFHRDLGAQAREGRITGLDRTTERRLEELQRILAGAVGNQTRFDALSQRDQLTVFNTHERVVALLNGDENARVECRRERAPGSRRSYVECATLGDRDVQRRLNQESLAALKRVQQGR